MPTQAEHMRNQAARLDREAEITSDHPHAQWCRREAISLREMARCHEAYYGTDGGYERMFNRG